MRKATTARTARAEAGEVVVLLQPSSSGGLLTVSAAVVDPVRPFASVARRPMVTLPAELGAVTVTLGPLLALNVPAGPETLLH